MTISASTDVSDAFQRGALDLGGRPGAPPPGWEGLPEVRAAGELTAAGASPAEVRLVLTLVAALDRARDADRLWSAAVRLHAGAPWTYDPHAVRSADLTELQDALRGAGVSQRHVQDAAAWRVIAESLAHPGVAPAVSKAVHHGEADARELLVELGSKSAAGSARFPYLGGPKVGPMWVRMLAEPGGARIANIQVLPVAVDTQVRKITEYLGVADTAGLSLERARPIIQAAWLAQVERAPAAGPPSLRGSCAALDPALWFHAKWGCTFCERGNERVPISTACGRCRFEPTAGSRAASQRR